MPRRIILPVRMIYEKRGLAWAFHYKNRETVRALCAAGWDGTQVAVELSQLFPQPQLQIDGSLLDIPLNIRREFADTTLSRFRLSIFQRDLLCLWYWTESGWQEFVRQYQSLPDVYENYYYKYDPEPNDRLLLVPISSKPKQGTAKKVQVPYSPVDSSVDSSVDNPVGNPVDKSGTSSHQKVHLMHFEGAER
jgi:hypothetical protein